MVNPYSLSLIVGHIGMSPFHMGIKVRNLGQLLPTQHTLIRFVSRMLAQMHVKMVLPVKRLSAVLTQEPVSVDVPSSVFTQLRFAGKPGATYLAHVIFRHLAIVTAHMRVESGIVRGSEVAQRTGEVRGYTR